MKRYTILGALLVAPLSLSGCAAAALATGSSSSDQGYNNVDTLAKAVSDTAESRMNNPSDPDYVSALAGTHVKDSSCIEVHKPQYTCMLDLSSGDHLSLKVTVSDDGQKYISTSDGN